MLVCRIQDLGGSRLRAWVLSGRWTATLCRLGGPGVNVEPLGGRETPISGEWRVSHAVEMDEGAVRVAYVGDHEVDLSELAPGVPRLAS